MGVEVVRGRRVEFFARGEECVRCGKGNEGRGSVECRVSGIMSAFVIILVKRRRLYGYINCGGSRVTINSLVMK